MMITKKNGKVCLFDDKKVVKSILKANADAEAEDEEITRAVARALAAEVFSRLTEQHEIITTAEVRECVFALLKEKGLSETAKCYMEFRR